MRKEDVLKEIDRTAKKNAGKPWGTEKLKLKQE